MDRNKNNPFRKEGGPGERIEKTKKESEWGKVKFNPVAKIVAAEEATPWSQFKNEIVQKHKEDKQESQNNRKNEKTQEFLKEQEQINRRNLIKSKRNEPTQWEDFSNETPSVVNKKLPKGKFQAIKSNIRNIDSIAKKDFDGRLLTFNQKNYLKKVITKETRKNKGTSFKQAVKDMQLNGVEIKTFKKKKSFKRK